jgi:hypothetical protein
LRELGNHFRIPIPPDEQGFTGRECPVPECLGYFKVQFGTGLKGENLPCHCPYCGHIDGHNKFFTEAQIEYAKSVAVNRISGAMIKDLKALEFSHPPRGALGIGMSVKVKGHPHPIQHYRERDLETEVVCDRCTLRYAIYGVFALCPDCGVHNSLQILNKNLELTGKEVALAAGVEHDLADHLLADALESAVSAFDGFGRETCRMHASKLSEPAKAEKISFQNLASARRSIDQLFGFDLAAAMDSEDWDFICRCFQKRHLLAHKMGVVDSAYLRAAKDAKAVIGRKISVEPHEVTALIALLGKLGASLVCRFEGDLCPDKAAGSPLPPPGREVGNEDTVRP